MPVLDINENLFISKGILLAPNEFFVYFVQEEEEGCKDEFFVNLEKGLGGWGGIGVASQGLEEFYVYLKKNNLMKVFLFRL